MRARAGTGRTAIACAAFACAAIVARAAMIDNSGFEDLDGELPAAWKVFVAPQPGATGLVVHADPYEGSRCVQLHIPTPYVVEPANNWSQPIRFERGGVRVRVSGFIKTKDATEAAIWLQCFQREPWMVLNQVSSSTDSPVYGTMRWTPVEFETTIPDGTDFAMIRCVLKGHGTAWFDSVMVTAVDDEATTKASPQEESVAPAKPIEVASPEPESISPVAARPIAVPNDDPKHEPGVADERLRESNEALALQLERLQAEIAELRAVLAHPPPMDAPDMRPPPLVPHGYRWKERDE